MNDVPTGLRSYLRMHMIREIRDVQPGSLPRWLDQQKQIIQLKNFHHSTGNFKLHIKVAHCEEACEFECPEERDMLSVAAN